MEFSLNSVYWHLERTPDIIFKLLEDLPKEWILDKAPGEDWSVFDILGHLIIGEKTDWIPRAQIIEQQKGDLKFEPFDRFAQFEFSKDKTHIDLMHIFDILRRQNLDKLRRMTIINDLDKKGIHPEFGEVTMRQLLATWVVHDMSHMAQIRRVMAKHWTEEVGPWKDYIPMLNR